TCAGCPRDAKIALRVNDDLVSAERADDAFAATVKLQPGENRVVAVATLPDGSLIESAAVTHNVRLTPRPTARIALTVVGDTIAVDGSPSQSSEFDQAAITEYQWEA